MHLALLYGAYGWLALIGGMHFTIDVGAQYIRGGRTPGPETTLYFGLNSAFALGQVAFGLLGIWLAWKNPTLLDQPPVMALSLLACLGWLAIAFGTMEYWEPKATTGLFGLILLAAFSTR
ncbi:hypothetical protein [Thalassospira mesophila]|uniref:Membrane protein n=1 Tax=Thalassospira mesophila TaxID=1293891 RepID=A0A1Y2KUM1_9PROT|nr:hypothetical protein [Thalassospira mesophila]OSQ34945.1 membrane protein [Thalassospira mesophila]